MKKMLLAPTALLSFLQTPPVEVEVLEVDFEKNTAVVRHSLRDTILGIASGNREATTTRTVSRSRLSHIPDTVVQVWMNAWEKYEEDPVKSTAALAKCLDESIGAERWAEINLVFDQPAHFSKGPIALGIVVLAATKKEAQSFSGRAQARAEFVARLKRERPDSLVAVEPIV